MAETNYSHVGFVANANSVNDASKYFSCLTDEIVLLKSDVKKSTT